MISGFFTSSSKCFMVRFQLCCNFEHFVKVAFEITISDQCRVLIMLLTIIDTFILMSYDAAGKGTPEDFWDQ